MLTISDITPYPKNPKIHDKRQLAILAKVVKYNPKTFFATVKDKMDCMEIAFIVKREDLALFKTDWGALPDGLSQKVLGLLK